MKKISTSIMVIVLIFLMSCSKNMPNATEIPSFTKISYWKGINGPTWSKWENPDGTFFTAGVNSDIADIQYAGIHWVRMRFKGEESYTQTIDPKVDTRQGYN